MLTGFGEGPFKRRIRVLKGEAGENYKIVSEFLVGVRDWFPLFNPVATGDLDGDGVPEIVCALGAQFEPAELIAYRHLGDYAFAEIARVAIAPHPQSIVMEDFDHDGRDEIAIVHNHNFADGVLEEPVLSILELDGAGTLRAVQTFVDPSTLSEGNIRAADFDRDGNLDLAYGDVSGRVLIHLGLGDGTFDAGVGYDTLHGVFALAVADFDRDGRPDIATTSIAGPNLSVQYNASCDTGCPADLSGSSDPSDPTYGDPDGDADSDDFFFLDAFATGDVSVCDLDRDGDCDADDFFAFLALFASPC